MVYYIETIFRCCANKTETILSQLWMVSIIYKMSRLNTHNPGSGAEKICGAQRFNTVHCVFAAKYRKTKRCIESHQMEVNPVNASPFQMFHHIKFPIAERDVVLDNKPPRRASLHLTQWKITAPYWYSENPHRLNSVYAQGRGHCISEEISSW